MNILNTSLEEAVKKAIFYKDEQGILRKKTKEEGSESCNSNYSKPLTESPSVLCCIDLEKPEEEAK